MLRDAGKSIISIAAAIGYSPQIVCCGVKKADR
jgi:hypothetical protein